MSVPTPHWQTWYTVARDVSASALAMTSKRVGELDTAPV